MVLVVLLCCVVSCVVVCVVWRVWCGTLNTHVCSFKTPPCEHSKRPRVYRQQVHMFYLCGRGAGTHGDVLNVHTEAFWMGTHGGGRRGEEEGGGHRQFC